MYLQFLNVAFLESFPNPANQALRSIYQPINLFRIPFKNDRSIELCISVSMATQLEADEQLLAMHSPETSDSDVDIAKHDSMNATDLRRSCTPFVRSIRVYVVLGSICIPPSTLLLYCNDNTSFFLTEVFMPLFFCY